MAVEGGAEEPTARLAWACSAPASGPWEGYAAAKLWKAGFRSNNLDPNARHCMASAVAGFMRTFGIDEPMGCYDDIEQADAFVLWGSNMAEMHPDPVDAHHRPPPVQPGPRWRAVHLRAPFSFDLADTGMIVFTPQTDLAILNYIAHYIIRTAVNKEFVKKHVNFKKGVTDIGYGLRPTARAGKDAKANGYPAPTASPRATRTTRRRSASTSSPSSSPSTPPTRSAKISGVPVKQARRRWPSSTPTQGQGVVVLDHGLQPAHARHLGQQHDLQRPPAHRQDRQPGNSPFSLTGQPSACGTAREVGTFAHRLPADMVVTNPEHRKHTEDLEAAAGTIIPDKIGLSRRGAEPRAEGRQARLLLDQHHQQHAGRAEHQRRDIPAGATRPPSWW